MNNKRPYTHILKNLFHEQATEIIPLLLPEYRVEQVLNIELPELKSTYIEGSPGKFEEGLVELALPGATLLGVYQTEWIEHSGNFERAYRASSSETDKPMYLLIEFQTEREDEKLSHRLMCNFAFVNRYVDNDTEQEDEDAEQEDENVEDEDAEQEDENVEDEDAEQEDENVEDEQKGTVRTTYVYPAVLCPFPQSVPAPVHDTFAGKVIHIFNFEVLGLWEKDAREFLNTHVSAIYFLLPAMKNADATLLGLAIEELAQRFQNDDIELGRHLTGLYLLLQQSDTMLEEEKLAAQEHLKRFMHLIKNDPYEEQ